ncbi:3'(2'),5'-bisphosphate nucleotidase [Ahniella affigens]|uniref:3'(2'),5'-bisphosphate nucleotidase CysQ n=1 Tax=Ahniella affigens TaxID=2021234 RepID=A0A2P1PNR6_9GAMM|nr:3'(2'),5'-bisphosphate nucleotidase CysQ [Ahniella affigens]AVP96466.1 3'(2'),5'-bisphosphate nucleotidase [Ahniella affigens]
MSDYTHWLEPVRGLAELAGRAILDIYRTDFDVEQKDDQSPLTAADLAAHRIISDGLRQLTPDQPILSEESRHAPFAERSQWSRFWLVDPLDGTREFVKRNGEFSVNIALIEAGRPVLGVVHAPVLGWSAAAAQGAGASLVQSNGDRQPLRVQPAKAPLRLAGSRSHGDARLNAVLARIGEHELRPMGSALKFVLVAQGEADVYLRFGPTSEWDTAAGQCVLEQAGGSLLSLSGEPFTYNRRDTLLNGDFIALGDPGLAWQSWLA